MQTQRSHVEDAGEVGGGVPDLSPSIKPLGIFLSDLHACHAVPPARGEAKDQWLQVVAETIIEVNSYAAELKVPVLLAGDLFDDWEHPPELINKVMAAMRGGSPPWYAVAGNHDLPYHNYEQRKRSAYWTLVESGVIRNLEPRPSNTFLLPGMHVVGIPWGFDIPELPPPKDGRPLVLLAHKYVWCEDHKHARVEKDTHVANYANIDCYDAAFFGDNHKGFETKSRHGSLVVNCGASLVRRADERDPAYAPKCWVLVRDEKKKLHVNPIALDQSRAVFSEEHAEKLVTDKADAGRKAEAEDFAKSLGNLAVAGVNFADALRAACRSGNVPADVRKLVHDWAKGGKP